MPDPGSRADEPAEDPFWQIARCEIEEFMIPQLLRDSDIFTMAWGLELRTPFVDHEFLRAVRRASPWPRRAGESHKTSLFRGAAGFLPPAHLNQRKRGFVLPFDPWLRTALTAATPPDDAFAVLRRERRFRSVVDGFLAGRLHWSRPWALYVLTRFRQRLAA
jgi:asparagine synthase (glutamine-hydrolysing)